MEMCIRDSRYMDGRGKFNLNMSGLVSYSHGEYFELGKKLGSFGSVSYTHLLIENGARAGAPRVFGHIDGCLLYTSCAVLYFGRCLYTGLLEGYCQEN